LRHFQQAGYGRAIRGTSPETAPALRAYTKAGFQPYALIGHVRLGRWQYDFCRPLKTT
jgi:hypothetical protein